MKDGKNKGEKQGLDKGLEAFKNRQEFLAFISEEDHEFYEFDDNQDEVEEMQFTKKQRAETSHVEKRNGATSAVGAETSHVETRNGATSAVSNSRMGNAETANGGKEGIMLPKKGATLFVMMNFILFVMI